MFCARVRQAYSVAGRLAGRRTEFQFVSCGGGASQAKNLKIFVTIGQGDVPTALCRRADKAETA